MYHFPYCVLLQQIVLRFWMTVSKLILTSDVAQINTIIWITNIGWLFLHLEKFVHIPFLSLFIPKLPIWLVNKPITGFKKDQKAWCDQDYNKLIVWDMLNLKSFCSWSLMMYISWGVRTWALTRAELHFKGVGVGKQTQLRGVHVRTSFLHDLSKLHVPTSFLHDLSKLHVPIKSILTSYTKSSHFAKIIIIGTTPVRTLIQHRDWRYSQSPIRHNSPVLIILYWTSTLCPSDDWCCIWW